MAKINITERAQAFSFTRKLQVKPFK